MGISKDAIRQRVRRGTLQADKGEDGRVYVYLDATADATPYTDQPSSDTTALISELREQVSYLRGLLEQANERDRENRRLLAAALERMPPQIEGPPDERERPETAPEDVDRVEVPPTPERPAERPWWRRMFGG